VRVDDVARVLDRPRRVPETGQTFAVETALATYELQTPALGAFQRRNAATAIAALELLAGHRPDG
jgi:UDP-N-acetylmuramyl tripeptide synthase